MSDISSNTIKLYKKNRFSFGDIVIYGTLILIFTATFYPFFYVLSLSVMPYERFINNTVHIGPDGFTLLYFKQILNDPYLPRAFGLSVLRVIVGTTLDVVCTMMCAYALSRSKLKYRRPLTFLLMVPMYFGAGMIPYYLTIRTYGLLNTFWVLVLPGLVSPMWFFVARAALIAYPKEILEAALIDGAGEARIFWNIIWPTNTPVIATLAMMYGVGHWNEYFWTRVLVQRNLWTAPVHLYSIMNTKIILQGLGLGIRLEPQSFIAAVAATLIIPVVIAYPFVQRYIISGLTLGAVKG